MPDKDHMQEESPLREGVETPPVDGAAPSPDGETPLAEAPDEVERSFKPFPVVGIGASAGGLEAFERFFRNMPPDSGMAFLVVQHLDPDRESILDSLLSGYTSMPVLQAEEGMEVKPDTVYLLPPNRNIALDNGIVHVTEPVETRGRRLPIDFLFRSLAEDQRSNAIAIILSGTGSDGTLGLKAIKGEGGLVMVQSPESATYDGMPHSALATGLVDLTLPAEEMPEQLLSYVRHEFFPGISRPEAFEEFAGEALERIFAVLRVQTGHNFTHYKPGTIRRRIERRMAVNRIASLDDYAQLVRSSSHEAHVLFRELLISVTSFFRDKEAFEALRAKVLPRILRDRMPDETIRVWVPGCATGEEAYSVAILLAEAMDEAGQQREVQIFATDIDSRAVEKARMGVYPENIALDVSEEQLKRFFHKEEGVYRVAPRIRDMLIFAEQSVIKDPPFSRLDLITCRNLLIYLDSELQQHVIPLFHYALKPGGFLMLGTSETLGKLQNLFITVDRKHKLFKRTDAGRSAEFALHVSAVSPQRNAIGEQMRPEHEADLKHIVERVLLTEFTPPCVIINNLHEIVYVHRRTGKYLELAEGEVNHDVVRMAREGLRVALASAIRTAKAEQQAVKYANIPVKTNGGTERVNLTVRPIDHPDAPPGLLMLLFDDALPPESMPVEPDGAGDGEMDSQRLMELERELQATREYLQTTIEELETSNEELKSTNEELQSSNEELQSTNEELETAKEELQSVNEELTTVNAELENKVDEVTQVNNDLRNLLASIEIGIVFLDQGLRVQRFNPSAAHLLNLIETDIERPLQHIKTNLEYDSLIADAEGVLETLIPHETRVRTGAGEYYRLRIRPYRTVDNAIEGVVMTFSQTDPPPAADDAETP